MDILTVTNVIAGASLGLSTVLSALAVRSYRSAAKTERESADNSTLRAIDLAGERNEQLEFQLRERGEVIDLYYDQLVKDQETMLAATGKIEELLATIKKLTTDVALYDDLAEDLDITLRTYFPNLPESYDPAEVVNTLLASALAQSFTDTFRDQPEDGRRYIADLIEALTSEVERRDAMLDEREMKIALLEGELDDTRMKHAHAVDVIRDRAETIREQGEVITELREERRLAEVELSATKTVANDDSADADRYAEELRKADELIHFYQLCDIELPERLIVALSEANFRISVRKNGSRGAGAVVRLAA